MKRRALEICILAYPRARRRRDRTYLRDLALDLSEDGGYARQAISLVRNGFAERIRGLGTRGASRGVVASAVAAIALAAGGIVAATSGIHDRSEVEELTCVGSCEERAGFVAERTRQGWACATDHRDRSGKLVVTTRCTLG